MRVEKYQDCLHCKQYKVMSAKGWCRACYSRWQRTGSVEYKRKPEKKECLVDGCGKFSVSHGYCDMHRKRLSVHGTLDTTRPNDWGAREKHPLYSSWVNQKRFRGEMLCEEWKLDFWKFADDVKERPSSNHRFYPIDKDAQINKYNWHWVERASSKTEDEKLYLREWARIDRAKNPRKYKDKQLMKSYGITIDDFDLMKASQGGRCKICNEGESAIDPRTKSPRDLAVDHCHSTSVVRGLLCSSCNTAIGLMRDDTAIMQGAIDYLNKFK